MRRKYLILLLIPLLIAFAGCGKKRHYVASQPELEAPSNLTATATSYKQINLFWQDNSTIEDGFRVCCDMGGNQYQTMDTLPANTTSFEHYNLQPLTKYTYYVQAYWGEEYANSREILATTPCPIEILDSRSYSYGNSGFIVEMRVKNNATERCEVEITVTFYNADGIEYDSQTETPILAGGEICTAEFVSYIPYFEYDWAVNEPGYSIEIMKAEILY